MAIIKQMNERLANMIAAGEVVDRAASVLKELMENAMDAQADQIDVYIENVGLSKIQVIDNGIGMDAVDAKNAFLRHATSKIFDEDGLNHIETLGFRGEALAAIASVSKVTLKTRQADGIGHAVFYENGHFVDEGVASLNKGTDITVEELFYNTPARFKYLKSEQTEKQHLLEIFDGIALAHPEISFQLYLDGVRMRHALKTENYEMRIQDILGRKMTENHTSFSDIFQKIEIKGYLLSPEFATARRKHIYIFINGRTVKNYPLVQSVIEGYHSLLMVGRYPLAFIFIQMDPTLLDVNVHPQKHEVKLANESLLSYHIKTCIEEALNKRSHAIPTTQIDLIIKEEPSYYRQKLDFDEPVLEKNEAVEIKRFPDFSYVGVIFGTYLLFQNEEGLYLIDQHAAQERIRYEYYYHIFGNPLSHQKQHILAHPLALPDNVIEMIHSYLDSFKTYGFEFNTDLEVIASPVWLKDEHMEIAVDKMLSMLEQNQTIDLSLLRDQLAKDVSCKGAIKANHALSQAEISQLIFDLKKCINPFSCPHGRPTIIKLSTYDIERLFRRVV